MALEIKETTETALLISCKLILIFKLVQRKDDISINGKRSISEITSTLEQRRLV
jgi:hypothetical protein